MKKNKFQKWILSFGAIGALIGISIGQLVSGSFDFSGILGALTAVIIIVTINIIRNWRKRDATPEFDERTTNNMLKFYAYASNGFILLSLLIFSFLSLKGIESVSVSTVLVSLFAFFILSGATAFVISKR